MIIKDFTQILDFLYMQIWLSLSIKFEIKEKMTQIVSEIQVFLFFAHFNNSPHTLILHSLFLKSQVHIPF
jgi:hypothetical protein